MATTFIFHGIDGHSGENWFPWMKKELEAAKHRCIVPDFPDPAHPRLKDWLKDFARYEDSFDEGTVFVGHSLGAAFALHALESLKAPIRACFAVAPVWEVMGNEFDPEMSTFTTAPYDWSAIVKNCGHFEVMQSDNDPYIDPEKSQRLAEHLKTTVTMILGGGHFNAAPEYTKFEKLREKIVQSLG